MGTPRHFFQIVEFFVTKQSHGDLFFKILFIKILIKIGKRNS